MLRYLAALCVVLGSLETSFGQGLPKPGKIVLDHWDVAYLHDSRAGYVHTYTQEVESNNRKLLTTTVELRLTVKRNNDVIQLGMDTGTVETEEGKVIGVFLRQYLGKNKSLELTGTVVGDQLKLQADGKPLKPAPWDDRVVGLYRQQKLFQDRNLKPGEEFSFYSFEPSINLVVKTFVKAKEFEDVELFTGRQKKKLMPVETRPEKIDKVQLPALVSWVGEDLNVQRSEVEIPGLGLVVLYRTTKAIANAPGALANLTDVGLSHVVKLNRRIPQPYDTTGATYRITIKNEEDPGTTFSKDDRQNVRNVKGNSLELQVRAGKSASEVAAREDNVSAEFTQSSYFINSADSVVQVHARKAVGLEKDPWKKALRIEKWVHENMRTRNHEALATADHVAKTLEGDCTEFAMLMAAMCRAQSIPSRTAVGLIYADVKGSPSFAFHMWTEVNVKGHWLPLDATLGRGKVGATHLKITDQSWHDTRSLTPLIPVVRILGKVSIEVLSLDSIGEK